MKALEGATLDRLLFMMNQTRRAASVPRTATPPTTPPAMAPILGPPPPLELLGVFVGVRLPVLLENKLVDTGGSTPVDSGWSEETRRSVNGNTLRRYAKDTDL